MFGLPFTMHETQHIRCSWAYRHSPIPVPGLSISLRLIRSQGHHIPITRISNSLRVQQWQRIANFLARRKFDASPIFFLDVLLDSLAKVDGDLEIVFGIIKNDFV